MTKYALLIIDMINIFLAPESPYWNEEAKVRGRSAIPRILQLAKAAREKNVPVIYVNHGLRRVGEGYDGGNVFESFEHLARKRGYPKLPLTKEMKDMFLQGTKWTRTVDELEPQDSDYVVRKNKGSGFYGGDLETLLQALESDTLIVTGISTEGCVRATCFDASNKGWKIIVPREAVESCSEHTQQRGLEDLSFSVKSVDEVLSLMEQTG